MDNVYRYIIHFNCLNNDWQNWKTFFIATHFHTFIIFGNNMNSKQDSPDKVHDDTKGNPPHDSNVRDKEVTLDIKEPTKEEKKEVQTKMNENVPPTPLPSPFLQEPFDIVPPPTVDGAAPTSLVQGVPYYSPAAASSYSKNFVSHHIYYTNKYLILANSF